MEAMPDPPGMQADKPNPRHFYISASRFGKANVMLRKLRILLLLLLLILVAASTGWESWLVRQWNIPLNIRIYPVVQGDDQETRDYVRTLNDGDFQEIADFMQQQSMHYRLQPIARPRIRLEPVLTEEPPRFNPVGASMLDSIVWSLAMRKWVGEHTGWFAGLGVIKLFVIYHPAGMDLPLESSLALRKGLIGVVNAYALTWQNAQNNIVITHEMLHTLGATDKYGPDLQPVFPDGFADPKAQPRLPQSNAEIMAGRIPLTPTRSVMPASLGFCQIGAKTAWEIGW